MHSTQRDIDIHSTAANAVSHSPARKESVSKNCSQSVRTSEEGKTQHMLAASKAFQNARARFAPQAAYLLGEFGRGVVVRVGSAGLRFEMLNEVTAKK